MADSRHPNVVNVHDVEPRVIEHGKKFGYSGRQLAAAAGAKAIGCTHYAIPPGRQGFPNHYHCANEEGVFILKGSGEMRIGEKTVEVREGDYVAFLTGPEYSHSIVAGPEGLTYLCFSTMEPIEIAGYPDSNKLLFRTGPFATQPGLRKLIRDQPSVEYYDGEESE